MDLIQFMLMWQALRDKGYVLSEAYEGAECIHEAFFGRRRYLDFEVAEQQYYKYIREIVKTPLKN